MKTLKAWILIGVLGWLPTLALGKALPLSLEFACFRKLKPGTEFNTLLQIDILPENAKPSNNQLVIEFRQNHKVVYQLSRQVNLGADSRFLEYWITLPDGHYEVSLEFHSPQYPVPLLYFRSFYARSLNQTWAVSDIQMMNPETGKHLLQKDLAGINGKIPFTCDLYLSASGLFTARAILYRQDENPYSDAAGKYSSLGQVSVLIPQIRGPQFTFSGLLPSEGLESGSYLVEVFIYQEDRIVAEAGYAFNIVWQRIPEILANPEQYAPFMKWKFADQTLPEALFTSSGFLEYWIQQNEFQGGYPYEAMEQYFQRALASDSLFLQAHAWNSPRGQYFLLLGEPDSITSLLYHNDSILIWRYTAPPLCKYFIKPEGETTWQELSLSHKMRLMLI